MSRSMPKPGAALSDVEYRVVDLVAQGLTNPEIGTEMWLTTETIRSHLYRIFRKLDARNRAHAVTRALETGQWVPDGWTGNRNRDGES